MALSPNYGWAEPDNSSLVKNGAADIRTLGDAIDTSVWNVGYGQAGKNKLINAAMAVAQRGATALNVTGSGRGYGPVDRFFGQAGNATGTFTIEQAVDAPAAANAGPYSFKAVVTVADTSIGSNKQYFVGQMVEAQNFAFFQFGTASALTVTISFWVKSSITGTFGVNIRNGAATRSYVSTYTISTANTWEKKSVTIPGDTSGTWLKDTGNGARIEWSLAQGTDIQTATPNVWTATNCQTTASQTNFMATVGNSFQLTAIQVEVGSKATPFQTASGGSIQGELAMCQRYYYRNTPAVAYGIQADAIATSTTAGWASLRLPVRFRVAPTAVEWGNLAYQSYANNIVAPSAITINSTTNTDMVRLDLTMTVVIAGHWGNLINNNNTAGFLGFSAEL